MEIIKGKTAGFCYGVKRAVDGTFNSINDHKKIYCLGELVHNQRVIENLEKKGVTFINNIDEVKEKDSILIIRAHGVTKSVLTKANKLNIEVIDFSCPNVLKIHNIAEEYASKGYYIFCIGSASHPEIIGTISYCEPHYSVIEDQNDLDKAINDLYSSKIKNLLIIVQTTYNKDKFQDIITIINERINKDINIIIKNTICSATSLRQEETSHLSKEVDAMIIVGGKNSSNTKKLFEIASKNNKRCFLIEDASELNIDDFNFDDKVGVMAGASTPEECINEVIEKLNKKS